MPPENYIELLMKEIRQRSNALAHRPLSSVYFGGGTPSLIEPKLIVSLINELANVGFQREEDCEVTIEVNPATLDQGKLAELKAGGINRFSVGAQSFNEAHLKKCGREHSAEQTRQTLDLLKNESYSFDLLFGLPGQTLKELEFDLDEVKKYDPGHLSAYCLTVPTGHPMSQGRPPDEIQIEMFELIKNRLAELGTHRYEISNFAKPGQESRHNLAYWEDRDFWGLGLSAHSYLKGEGPSGTRFWNPKKFDLYENQVSEQPKASLGSQLLPPEFLPAEQKENLMPNESLTDYCHTRLRTMKGLKHSDFLQKFTKPYWDLVLERSQSLLDDGLLTKNSNSGSFILTEKGVQLSNQVFLQLSFAPEELGFLRSVCRGPQSRN